MLSGYVLLANHLTVFFFSVLQYDAHRLPPELLEEIGDNVAAAVEANVTHWNRHQRSRALLLLSRLLLVPGASLWVLLVSGLLSKDGQLTLPEAAQRAADIAHTAGKAPQHVLLFCSRYPCPWAAATAVSDCSVLSFSAQRVFLLGTPLWGTCPCACVKTHSVLPDYSTALKNTRLECWESLL